MYLYKFKTNVQKKDDAEALQQMLQPFFIDATISFDLRHDNKLLTIKSEEDENHNDIVIEIIKQVGFECEVIE